MKIATHLIVYVGDFERFVLANDRLHVRVDSIHVYRDVPKERIVCTPHDTSTVAENLPLYPLDRIREGFNNYVIKLRHPKHGMRVVSR